MGGACPLVGEGEGRREEVGMSWAAAGPKEKGGSSARAVKRRDEGEGDRPVGEKVAGGPVRERK
jgi:hypothetical protein